ncbi:unnamed protein product [Paramecium sonneborni]|uniref:Protein kinase domain-containing protein n=1 Tax=Paramecium sonneborni TaxID=65129 RepID=A0A8S1K4X8_9CILI|nr:unnamed protein product [Paramecium sonneborni]
MSFLQYPPDKKIQNYQFSFKAKVGKGAYGTVYAGKNMNDNKIVALKIIDKKILQTDYANQLIASEIEIMKLIEDKNIVKLIDVLQSVNNTYIITEYCNGGDLREYLKKRKLISEIDAMNIFRDLLHGIKALLKIGIIHRDIKPANIMIHDGEFKITDFGFAKQVDSHIDAIMNSLVGTPLYMSPQILKRQSYTSKCDIWSLGLILYEMLYGITPWHSSNLVELMTKLDTKPLEFPSFPKVSDQTKFIIKNCLQINEEKRISWDTLFDLVDIQEQPIIYNHSILPIIQKNSAQQNSTQYQSQQNQQNNATQENVSFIEKRSNQRTKQRTESMGNGNFVSRHNRSLSNAKNHDKDKSDERQKVKCTTPKLSYLQKVTPQRQTVTLTQESERDRSNSIIKFANKKLSLMKYLENMHTTSQEQKDSKEQNNKSPSYLQSNSTTNTSNRHNLESDNSSNKTKVTEFQIEEKQREPINNIINNGYYNSGQNLKLKRTFSNNFKENSLSPMNQNQNSIQQLLKLIQNQYDLIPSHFAIKKQIEQIINQHKTMIMQVKDLQYSQEDSQDLKKIINRLIDYLNEHPNDNFAIQLSVMLLLILNYNQVVNFCLQQKSTQLSRSIIDLIKQNQSIQQKQLILNPAFLRENINKQLS